MKSTLRHKDTPQLLIIKGQTHGPLSPPVVSDEEVQHDMGEPSL